MKLSEAIEVLKDAKYIGSDEYASDYDRRMKEAIDTVVAEVEKPLQSDDQITKSAITTVKCTYPYPDDEAYHDFPEFIDGFEKGARWMGGLIQERRSK